MTSGKCRLPDAARRIEGACVRRERWLGGAGPYGGEECLSMRFAARSLTAMRCPVWMPGAGTTQSLVRGDSILLDHEVAAIAATHPAPFCISHTRLFPWGVSATMRARLWAEIDYERAVPPSRIRLLIPRPRETTKRFT